MLLLIMFVWILGMVVALSFNYGAHRKEKKTIEENSMINPFTGYREPINKG